MERAEFKRKIALIEPIAAKYKWTYSGNDIKTFRISYADELSIWRIDIYLSKMTVCMLPKGGNPKYFKRQNLEKIEQIFRNPYRYEI